MQYDGPIYIYIYSCIYFLTREHPREGSSAVLFFESFVSPDHETTIVKNGSRVKGCCEVFFMLGWSSAPA